MKITTAFLCIISLVSLSACNTISGIGKDVQNMGSNIDAASQAASKSM